MTDLTIPFPRGGVVTLLKVVLFLGYLCAFLGLIHALSSGAPFVYVLDWSTNHMSMAPAEQIGILLAFAFGWPLLIQLLTSSVFGLSRVGAKKTTVEPVTPTARLGLPGGWTYFSDEASGRCGVDRGGAPRDIGTVTLPLVCHHTYGVARTTVALSWAALMGLAPAFFQQGISMLDRFLFPVAFYVLLVLLVAIDLITIASVRLLRVRTTDGCAVIDAPEPTEPRIIAVPFFGWRRDLAKRVSQRQLEGVMEAA